MPVLFICARRDSQGEGEYPLTLKAYGECGYELIEPPRVQVTERVDLFSELPVETLRS